MSRRPHVNAEGKFQSDKYPTCPAGKVPLSVDDPSARDLLWTYAQRRRAVDPEFAEDLESCLRDVGYDPDRPAAMRSPANIVAALRARPMRMSDLRIACAAAGSRIGGEYRKFDDAVWDLLQAGTIRMRSDSVLEVA